MSLLDRGVRRLPLRGPDLVLLATHPRWKGVETGHNTLLVIECDGPVCAGRITRALDRLLDACPWPAARLRRRFPWGRLHWAAGTRDALVRPTVQSTTLEDPEPLKRIVLAELNTPIEPRREAPVRFRVLDGGRDLEPGRSFLVLTWFHSLMDARGGQNLLEYLDRIDRGDAVLPGDRDWLAEGTDGPRLSLRERRRIAGRSSAYLRTLAPEPPVSPGAALVPPGRACYLQERFVASEDGDQRARRELPWRLALVGKAMADLWRRRGLPDTPFLLPVSVDQRPKGAPGPIFGSRLAFHFARFRPSDTGDLPALSRALRLQMADAVRAGHIEANAVAMEFLHYLPLSTVLRVLPWTAGGELFSFNCADLGEWPLAQCFGRRVLNAYHVPVVPPRPGIGVFFNRCGSHDNLVVSWIEGVVSRDDAARIVEVVRDGMGWTRSP